MDTTTLYDAQLLVTDVYNPAEPWRFVTYHPQAFQGDVLVVAVLGLFNRGKTFLINLLADLHLPAALHSHTVGMAFKRPERVNNHGYILLDTAGLDSPARPSTYMIDPSRTRRRGGGGGGASVVAVGGLGSEGALPFVERS